MKEKAMVKSAEGKLCTCSIMRKSACGENCATCKATCKAMEHTFVAKNTAGAKEGDWVFVEMPTKNVMKTAFLVYILPLIAFFIGFTAFFETGKSEAQSALWGIVFGGAVWILLSFWGKYKKEELTPEITEIIDEDEQN